MQYRFFFSVEERYNPLMKKEQIAMPNLVHRVQGEKKVETRTHKEFSLNLSGALLFGPFKVMDY